MSFYCSKWQSFATSGMPAVGVSLETSITCTRTEFSHNLNFSYLFFKATEKCAETFQFFHKHGFAAKKKDVTEVVT